MVKKSFKIGLAV